MQESVQLTVQSLAGEKRRLDVTLVTAEPSAVSGRLDSNQRPPEPHSGKSESQGRLTQKVASDAPSVCTPVCTNQAPSAPGCSLDLLAAALLNLSPEDRARLTAVLLRGPAGDPKAGESKPE